MHDIGFRVYPPYIYGGVSTSFGHLTQPWMGRAFSFVFFFFGRFRFWFLLEDVVKIPLQQKHSSPGTKD